MNIVVTGFMGTGKTSVGRKLASELGLKFVDTDGLIEEQMEMTVPDIFSHYGEPYFRGLEKGIIDKLTEGEYGDGLVVSTGGGVITDDSNRAALRKWAPVVCLTATVDEIIKRVEGSEHRPLLNLEDRKGVMERLLEKRERAYRDTDVRIDTTSMSVTEVVTEIKDFLKKRGLI